MKAAVHTSYGPPNVVRIAEVEKPTAKDNQVLVKVHATTVNRTDSALRAAKPFVNRFFTGLTRPRVTVLGNELPEKSRRPAVASRPSRSATGYSATTGPGSAPTLNT
jgi:hypothetical protein